MRKAKVCIVGALCVMCVAALCLAGCGSSSGTGSSKSSTKEASFEMQPLVGTALDYSNKDNWMFFDNNDSVDHDTDVFFLYPTSVSSDVKTDVCEDINDMRQNAHVTYLQSADTLTSFTNMYAPYYRQISGIGIAKNPTADALMDAVTNNVTRTDVYAALDYYFQNCNNGKPYILAGHSQGSCCLKVVLSEYMKAHPEYLKNMVACYAIGYYFPDSWFDENPQVKKATGETDTGVLITWNTEGPDGTMYNLPLGKNNDGFVINPLNWKTDETSADISLNKGSLFVDKDIASAIYSEIQSNGTQIEDVDISGMTAKEASDAIRNQVVTYTDGAADATINKARGALVTTTYTSYIPRNAIFGDVSCHFEDWSLYTMNIRENAQKRIAAFLGREGK